MPAPLTVFWFRRDLRLKDNAGLYHALNSGNKVLPVFIFDRNILDELEDKKDGRVEFIHTSLQHLQKELVGIGSGLKVFYGNPIEAFRKLMEDYFINAVFTNHDYEPYGRERDKQVAELLKTKGIAFHSFKDQVIFEKNEVVKEDGKPYTVFTPYSRKWKTALAPASFNPYESEKRKAGFWNYEASPIPALSEIGFEPSGLSFPSSEWNAALFSHYKMQRDFPAIAGTSRLSVHLRFGTISIRQLAADAARQSETFLNELIWREFYQSILWHFPGVLSHSFKPEYDSIAWRNDQKEFEAWKNGQTGYPIVDAGMRELMQTGYMHNRVRMIVASFLTKHLLIDWRWGEAWFAAKLLDYELASNNGGWQWAAGSGCDAAPYFRIFNPYIQTKKFDPEFQYISKWVPEWQELNYPPPIVDHDYARKRCLETYNKALKSKIIRNGGSQNYSVWNQSGN